MHKKKLLISFAAFSFILGSCSASPRGNLSSGSANSTHGSESEFTSSSSHATSEESYSSKDEQGQEANPSYQGEVFSIDESYFENYRYGLDLFTRSGYAVRIHRKETGALSLTSFDQLSLTFEEGIDPNGFSIQQAHVFIFDESITEIHHFPAVDTYALFDTSIAFTRYGAGEDDRIFDDYYLYFTLVFHGDVPSFGRSAFDWCTITEIYYDGNYTYPAYLEGTRAMEIGFQASIPDMSVGEYSLAAAQVADRDLKGTYDSLANEGRAYEYLFPWCNSLSEFEEMVDFANEQFSEASTELEKADAVFTYVSREIHYDSFHEGDGPYEAWIAKGGVCSQYVAIMHDLLAALGVVSFYCNGYTRSAIEHVGAEFIFTADDFALPEYQVIKDSTHAWIGVIVDGEVRYYDPTWHLSFGRDLEALSNHVVTFAANFHQVKPDEVDEVFLIHSIFLDHNDVFIEGDIHHEGGMWRNVYLDISTTRRHENTTPYVGKEQKKGSLYHDCIVGGGDPHYAREDRLRIDLASFLQFLLFVEEKLHIDVTLPQGVVEENGFYYVPSLSLAVCYLGQEKNVTIPSLCADGGIIYVGPNFFPYGSKVESVVVEEGITAILQGFNYLEELRSISLPSSLTAFNGVPSIFGGCSKLEKILVSENNDFYSSSQSNDALLSKDGSILYYGAAGDDGQFNIDPSVSDIRAFAFSFSPLKTIFIPNSVKTIANSTFSYSDLEEVVFEEREDEITLNTHVFNNCLNLAHVTLPNMIRDLQRNVSGRLPDYTFSECPRLHQIEIPEGIVEIGDGCFMDSSLVSIQIPSSLQSIGYGAFLYDNELREVVGDPNDILLNAGYQANKIASFADSSLQRIDDYLFYMDGDQSILVEYFGNESEVALPDYGFRYMVGGPAFFNSIPVVYGIQGQSTFTFGMRKALCTSFADRTPITKIIVPTNVYAFNDGSFNSCRDLVEAVYLGTTEEWRTVICFQDWKVKAPFDTITCSDGEVYVGRKAYCH